MLYSSLSRATVCTVLESRGNKTELVIFLTISCSKRLYVIYIVLTCLLCFYSPLSDCFTFFFLNLHLAHLIFWPPLIVIFYYYYLILMMEELHFTPLIFMFAKERNIPAVNLLVVLVSMSQILCAVLCLCVRVCRRGNSSLSSNNHVTMVIILKHSLSAYRLRSLQFY